eukprot:gene619-3309_t
MDAWGGARPHFPRCVTGVGKIFHPNKPPNFDQPFSWSDEFYSPKTGSCPGGGGSDVWCVAGDDAEFDIASINGTRRAQRRLRAAAKNPYPFFVAAVPHTPYRSPQKYYDMDPPAEEIATPAFPDFPDGEATGLAWFSCQAEGKQYSVR